MRHLRIASLGSGFVAVFALGVLGGCGSADSNARNTTPVESTSARDPFDPEPVRSQAAATPISVEERDEADETISITEQTSCQLSCCSARQREIQRVAAQTNGDPALEFECCMCGE